VRCPFRSTSSIEQRLLFLNELSPICIDVKVDPGSSRGHRALHNSARDGVEEAGVKRGRDYIFLAKLGIGPGEACEGVG